VPEQDELLRILDLNRNSLLRNPVYNLVNLRGEKDRRFYGSYRKNYLDPSDNGTFVGSDAFPYVKPINLKLTLAKGFHQREHAIVISDYKLPKGELSLDSYGNFGPVVKLKNDNTKTETKVLHNWVVRGVERIPEYNNIPVVIVSKVPNRYSALMTTFAVMGFSSIGRFLKDAVENVFAPVLGSNAETIATAVVSAIYLTNLAALVYQKVAAKKDGQNKVTNAANLIMLGGLLAPLLIGGMGFTSFEPTWWRLGVLVASMLALGIGAAGVQQSGNNRAKDIKMGKDANSVTAIAQLFKSIGSFGAYTAFAIATWVFGQWTAMFPILAVAALANIYFSTKAANAARTNPNLPSKPLKLISLTPENAPKADEEKPKVSAAAKVKQVAKGAIPELLRKDNFVLSLFTALFLFCGSEIVVSQATKAIITATLMKPLAEVMPAMASDVALTTIINGILTMGPIMLGRFLGGKIQDSAKNVPGYVKKLLTLSAAMAVTGALALTILRDSVGAWALLPVFLANLGFANLFSLSFGMVKDHVKDKYAKMSDGKEHPKYKDYTAQAGTISTLALTACWALPSFVALMVPATNSVFDRIPLALGAIFIGLMALTGISIAKKRNYFASNPFSWKKKAEEDSFVKDINADILNVYRADKIAKYLNKKGSPQNTDKYAEKLEQKLSETLGITTKQLNEALTGFMKDSKTKLSEKEKAEVTAKLQKFVSENLGLNEKEIKEISAGNISLETRMKIDAALDKIIKAEGN
jgi:hypothetical protein